jgi:hypothetical protein
VAELEVLGEPSTAISRDRPRSSPRSGQAGQIEPLGSIGCSLLLFAASFAVTAALLHLGVHALVGDTMTLYATGRSEKLAMMPAWRGKYFSAIFGTSHLANGFDPRAFDRQLAASPAATHSVNLALIGGSQTEQRRMALEWVSHLVTPAEAGAPPQPCFVILELNAGVNFPSFDVFHPRAINIYDWESTRLAASMVGPELPRTQQAGRLGAALVEMGLHDLSLGMLSNFIFKPALDHDLFAEETSDDRRGLLIESTPAAVASDVSRVLDVAPPKPAIDHAELTQGNTRLIEELDRVSRVKHYSPVYVVSPMVTDVATTHLYPDHLMVDGRMVPIINVARGDLYPQLYQGMLWHDGAHFDGEGAALFSRIFAQSLQAWYAQHGGPVRCN